MSQDSIETIPQLPSPVPQKEEFLDEVEEATSNNLNNNGVVVSDFWNEGAYKRITKRIDDGARILDDLAKIMHERAEIENLYASKLKAWEKKWKEVLHRSAEYGSVVEGVSKLLDEGNSVSDLHFSVHGKLDNLAKETLQWKSQKYPKSLTKYKELRRSEEAFSKAQGPWATKYKEAQKCMKAYHTAKDLQSSLKEQDEDLRNSKADTTQDQLNKIANKINKNEMDVENTSKRYHIAIRDISSYDQKYIGDMNYEFNVCQNFEKARREKIKEKLEQLISCLDRRIFFENYNTIYAETEAIIKNMDVENDLQWYWSQYGPDESVFTSLEYIEYDPILHSSNSTNTSKGASNSPKPKRAGSNSSVCTAL